jgi:hypothetical protein
MGTVLWQSVAKIRASLVAGWSMQGTKSDQFKWSQGPDELGFQQKTELTTW